MCQTNPLIFHKPLTSTKPVPTFAIMERIRTQLLEILESLNGIEGPITEDQKATLLTSLATCQSTVEGLSLQQQPKQSPAHSEANESGAASGKSHLLWLVGIPSFFDPDTGIPIDIEMHSW